MPKAKKRKHSRIKSLKTQNPFFSSPMSHEISQQLHTREEKETTNVRQHVRMHESQSPEREMPFKRWSNWVC